MLPELMWLSQHLHIDLCFAAIPAVLNLLVFTARGYAKRGICRRRVSVCLCVCVCHTPVLYQNG